MAVKINLLPQDYTVSDSVARVIKIVRPLNVILLSIFLVAALGAAGFFILSSITIKNLSTTNSTLTNQIESLQSAQQQVVLLKDRLGKIRRIMSKPGAYKNIAPINPILVAFFGSSTLTELDADSEKTLLTLNFKSGTDLSNFLDSISENPSFSNVAMNSFNYNPSNGYTVGFSFVISKQ